MKKEEGWMQNGAQKASNIQHPVKRQEAESRKPRWDYGTTDHGPLGAEKLKC